MNEFDEEELYQFENERELMSFLGLDPDTIEGDYAEAYHHMNKFWEKAKIDQKFNIE